MPPPVAAIARPVRLVLLRRASLGLAAFFDPSHKCVEVGLTPVRAVAQRLPHNLTAEFPRDAGWWPGVIGQKIRDCLSAVIGGDRPDGLALSQRAGVLTWQSAVIFDGGRASDESIRAGVEANQRLEDWLAEIAQAPAARDLVSMRTTTNAHALGGLRLLDPVIEGAPISKAPECRIYFPRQQGTPETH